MAEENNSKNEEIMQRNTKIIVKMKKKGKKHGNGGED